MRKNYKSRGGRRHFHVILFILFILVITIGMSIPVFASTQSNPQIQQTIPIENQLTIENYTPQQICVSNLYDLITQVSAISDSLEKYQLAAAVYTYGIQFSIQPELLLAIVRVQSNFKKKVRSAGNCAGYFQVNLNCHRVSKNFFNDTYEQTKKACEIYSYCRKMYNGSITKALNAYNGNASLSNPYANKIMKYYNQFKQKSKNKL